MLKSEVKSMSFRPVRWVISAASVAALVACGGGGGGGTTAAPVPTPSTTQFPLTTGIANLVNTQRSSSFTITGTATSNGQTLPVTGSGTYSDSASTVSTFEGATALRKTGTVTGSQTVGNVSVPVTGTSVGFFDTNYGPLGRTDSTTYCVTTTKTALPTSVRIGDTNTWYSQICYANSAKTTRLSSSDYSYVIEPFSESIALVKVNQRTVDSAGAVSNASTSFKLSTLGTMTRFQEVATVLSSGVLISLTLTYQ